MRKCFKTVAMAVLMVSVIGSVSGCVRVEQPEWLEQTICEHEYESVRDIKLASCTTNGAVEQECIYCGHTRIAKVNAFGHDVIIDTMIESTCATKGLSEGKHCIRCGEVLESQVELDYGSHTDEDLDGVCDDCGATIFYSATYKKIDAESEMVDGSWYRCAVQNTQQETIHLLGYTPQTLKVAAVGQNSAGVTLNNLFIVAQHNFVGSFTYMSLAEETRVVVAEQRGDIFAGGYQLVDAGTSIKSLYWVDETGSYIYFYIPKVITLDVTLVDDSDNMITATLLATDITISPRTLIEKVIF